MADTSGIRCYQETAVQTLGPEKLIVLLYEGLLRYLRQARAAIAARDMAGKARSVNNAQAIVVELKNSLDHAVGGGIAANLETLYNYIFTEDVNLLIDNDPAHVENVERVLAPLLEAWRQIPPGTAERARRERESAAAPAPAPAVQRTPAGPVPASPQPVPHGAYAAPGRAGEQTAPPAAGSLSLAV